MWRAPHCHNSAMAIKSSNWKDWKIWRIHKQTYLWMMGWSFMVFIVPYCFHQLEDIWPQPHQKWISKSEALSSPKKKLPPPTSKSEKMISGISLSWKKNQSEDQWKIQSAWWFQPIWKKTVKMGSSSPIFGVKMKKCLSCHHLAISLVMANTHAQPLKAG